MPKDTTIEKTRSHDFWKMLKKATHKFSKGTDIDDKWQEHFKLDNCWTRELNLERWSLSSSLSCILSSYNFEISDLVAKYALQSMPYCLSHGCRSTPWNSMNITKNHDMSSVIHWNFILGWTKLKHDMFIKKVNFQGLREIPKCKTSFIVAPLTFPSTICVRWDLKVVTFTQSQPVLPLGREMV